MFELDVLFDISSSGKIKFWKTWVQEYDNYSEIIDTLYSSMVAM